MSASSAAPAAESPVVAVRVSVRCPSADVFCERYWRLVNGDRIFIVTSVPQAPGTRLRFTMVLSDGVEVMRGQGRVLKARKTPGGVSGMEVRFEPTDGPSRALVAKLHAMRVADQGAPPRGKEFEGESPTEDFKPVPPAPAPRPAPRPAIGAVGSKIRPPQSPFVKRPLPSAEDWTSAAAGTPPPAAKPVEASPPPPPKLTPAYVGAAMRRSLASAPALPAVAPAPAPAPPAVAVVAEPFQADRTPLPPPSPLKPSADEPTEPHKEPSLEGLPELRFAEQWRPPGRPAAPDSQLPANPFAEINDAAIEFFVEWSIERSTETSDGPDEASFADVPMSWAGAPSEPATPKGAVRRSTALWLAAAGIAAGLAAGLPAGALWLHRRIAPPITPVAAIAPPPPPVTAPPPPAPAEPAAEEAAVEKPAPAEEPRPAALPLTVRSTPPGATLLVDSHQLGRTPVRTTVAAGPHKLVLQHERYQSTALDVVAEKPRDVAINLSRPTTKLVIVSQPAGAEVAISGHPIGRTPLTLTRAGFEHYQIRVWLAGKKPVERTIYLRPGDPPVSFNLAASTYTTAAPSAPTRR